MILTFLGEIGLLYYKLANILLYYKLANILMDPNVNSYQIRLKPKHIPKTNAKIKLSHCN